LRRSQVRPLVQLPVSCKPKGKGRRSRAMALAALIRSRRKNPECVTFPARHSYTTHCGLRSMMALARRCGDMDVHRTSTGAKSRSSMWKHNQWLSDLPNSRPIRG
jgi:hypothetical protein